MFKIPFVHYNTNNKNRSGHREKAATSLSNERFVFIHCKHNNHNSTNIYNNPYNKNNNNNNNNNDNDNNDYNSNVDLSNEASKVNHINSKTKATIKYNTTNQGCYRCGNLQRNNRYDSNDSSNASVCSTAQNSWRPQLPLPKENSLACDDSGQHFYSNNYTERKKEEEEANEFNETDTMDKSHNIKVTNNAKHNLLNTSNGGSSIKYKRWSFRRLFRRKKHIEMHCNDSSTDDDNDRSAGFSPSKKHLRSAVPSRFTGHKKKQKKLHHQDYHDVNGLNLDESIYVNKDEIIPKTTTATTAYHDNDYNELFLPVETVPPLPSKKHYYYHDGHIETQSQPKQMSLAMHNLSARKLQTPCSTNFNSAQGFHSNYPSSHVDSIENVRGSSNDGEVISINSANYLKYRSNENLQAINNYNSQNRKSRAARNERYFKRLSRDSESSHGQAAIYNDSHTKQRWKTQQTSLTVYQPLKQESSSAKHSQLSSRDDYTQNIEPYIQWNQLQTWQQPNYPLNSSVNKNKRSISYDSQLHLQNIYGKGKQQVKSLSPPPLPPPRDSLTQVNLNGSKNQNVSYNDLRPTSYAFDQIGVPVVPLNAKLIGRCVSDDKIWAQPQLYNQSIQSLNKPLQMVSQSQRNNNFPNKIKDESNVNDSDYRYVADSAPRSRKPIHMLEDVQSIPRNILNRTSSPPSSGILRTTKSGLPESPIDKIKTTQFWKCLDEKVSQKIQESSLLSRGRNVNRSVINDVKKPRSISTSRVLELKTYTQPIYSEVNKPKQHKFLQKTDTSQQLNDEVDNVVCSTLSIKPSEYNQNDNNKRNSLGNYCKRRSIGDMELLNKNKLNDGKQQLSEGKNCQRNMEQLHLNISQIVVPRKKATNLEEAINELEAIYHSLGLNNENEKAPLTLPSPKDFDQYALNHADEYDDYDSPAGEPDPIKDDVAYRNIKLANLQHKITEKQPPFGIPVRPLRPAANSDYLKIPIERLDSCCYQHVRAISPDIIKDDLAVRTLRKEPSSTPSCMKNAFPTYPNDSNNKKNRALRTQSANVYALMRNASKPSGGSDVMCYSDFTCVHCLDRSGSLSDISKDNNATTDTPSTLKLLQNIREQDNCNKTLKTKKLSVPFRHPSQGGAICQLPVVLNPSIKESKMKALPCKSVTSGIQLINNPRPSSRMEEALNKIAQDAQESSIKLSHDLQKLRKEALISAPKANLLDPSKDENALEIKLNEIEKVTKAAKQCSEMLLNALPDRLCTDSEEITEIFNNKNERNEDKLIRAIDEVSEAANKVCEKILRDIQHKDTPIPLPKDNNISDNNINNMNDNIDEIAKHCLRQFKDLTGNHYNYNNKINGDCMSTTSLSACNLEIIEAKSQKYVKDLSHSNLTESSCSLKKKTTKEDATIGKKIQENTAIDEIDQIIRECEEQILGNIVTIRPVSENCASQIIEQSHTNSVSSDICSSSYSETFGGKSSSPSDNRCISSSIASCQPYSSNGHLKTSSREVQVLHSADPIKTVSTTSYDVQSTTSNATNYSTSGASLIPSPINFENLQTGSINNDINDADITKINVTGKNFHRRFSSPFQYNSADELAKIFGHDDKETQFAENSGNEVPFTSPTELSEIVPNSPAECPSCAIESSAITQPAVVNELCLPYYPSATTATSTTTTTTTKRNVVCHEPLNTSDLLFNINTTYSTNQNITHNHARKLDIINANKRELLLSRQNGQEDVFHKICTSKLNVLVVDFQKPLHDNSNDYPAYIEPYFNSYCDDLSSNTDSGNVSLADFPLLATTTSNTSSASLHLQTNYNSRYQFIKTYITEITLDHNKQECKNLSENNVQNVEKPREIVDRNKANINANESVIESEACDYEIEGELYNSLKRNRLLFKETKINSLAKISKEESSLNTRRCKESVIIETPKLQLTIIENKVNYEFNITPELKSFHVVNSDRQSTENLNIFKEKNGAEETGNREEKIDDAGNLHLNNWPLRQFKKNVKNDHSKLEVPCTSRSASMDLKTVTNVLGERRLMVNGLTLLEHLVVACTFNSLNNNDLFIIFLIIISVLIIKILTFT